MFVIGCHDKPVNEPSKKSLQWDGQVHVGKRRTFPAGHGMLQSFGFLNRHGKKTGIPRGSRNAAVLRYSGILLLSSHKPGTIFSLFLYGMWCTGHYIRMSSRTFVPSSWGLSPVTKPRKMSRSEKERSFFVLANRDASSSEKRRSKFWYWSHQSLSRSIRTEYGLLTPLLFICISECNLLISRLRLLADLRVLDVYPFQAKWDDPVAGQQQPKRTFECSKFW